MFLNVTKELVVFSKFAVEERFTLEAVTAAHVLVLVNEHAVISEMEEDGRELYNAMLFVFMGLAVLLIASETLGHLHYLARRRLINKKLAEERVRAMEEETAAPRERWEAFEALLGTAGAPLVRRSVYAQLQRTERLHESNMLEREVKKTL